MCGMHGMTWSMQNSKWTIHDANLNYATVHCTTLQNLLLVPVYFISLPLSKWFDWFDWLVTHL